MDRNGNPADQVAKSDKTNNQRKMMRRLLKRYGFDSGAQTLQSIAEELGLEREEVRQIEYNAYLEIVNWSVCLKRNRAKE